MNATIKRTGERSYVLRFEPSGREIGGQNRQALESFARVQGAQGPITFTDDRRPELQTGPLDVWI
jgi:hypothetical protein